MTRADCALCLLGVGLVALGVREYAPVVLGLGCIGLVVANRLWR